MILFFGNAIFSFFGITLTAFQIGSGLVLFISGIQMIQTNNVKPRSFNKNDDPSLFPLTLPITVGPGTIGALFVLSSSFSYLSLFNICLSIFGICLAVFAIWILLYFSKFISKMVGYNGLEILSKLTGLFLVILSIQSILNGLEYFLQKTF
jgi:multiple antibiotic resistance protein